MQFRFSLKFALIVVTVIAVTIALAPVAIREYRWFCAASQLRAYQATDFFEYGYLESRAAARPHFDQLINEIVELSSTASQDEKYTLFKNCIERINSEDIVIETVEREEFCERLAVIAEMAGIIKNGDRQEFDATILEWRDW